MKEVKITKKYVLSKFDKEDLDIFKNELFIYLLAKQKNISFIPKLIDYNCDKLYIKTENVGILLYKIIVIIMDVSLKNFSYLKLK